MLAALLIGLPWLALSLLQFGLFWRRRQQRLIGSRRKTFPGRRLPGGHDPAVAAQPAAAQ